MTRKYFGVLLASAILALAGWGGSHVYTELRPQAGSTVPVTRVKRGDVTIHVSAQGAVQGGKSRVLVAPMTGSREIVLTMLRRPGEMVEKDAIVDPLVASA